VLKYSIKFKYVLINHLGGEKMKWVSHFLILVGFLMLTGCSERELTFDRAYPDTSHLDELRKSIQLKLEEEIKNLPANMTENKVSPRELHVSIPNGKFSILRAFQFCWAVTIEECESMQPKHPYENKNNDLFAENSNPNEVIRLTPDLAPGTVPFPVRIEGYYYDENNNLQFHEELIKVGDSFLLTAPAESKSFIFQIKAYYEGDVEGISYHPFRIAVK